MKEELRVRYNIEEGIDTELDTALVALLKDCGWHFWASGPDLNPTGERDLAFDREEVAGDRMMFDSGAWQCKSCDTVLGWIADGRLTVWVCRGQSTIIDSGDVKCHVCGETQRFCPAEQQAISEILNEDGCIDTLHLGC